ncbi:protein farnesyltransferase [Sugiyamaella lignohabitans]|uniref:Protein farnesyltransferase subunit beta n=1 Tax=Sugiyamaella lignohabitans TaxID=796027 RepID=A0A161HJ11_9ASCO|nr:protein farnesyltransferase [Sugiyamaella lignohabitans]ANB12627.1 protein farnesyltransferase [Sugiyamaella lignohabitans]
MASKLKAVFESPTLIAQLETERACRPLLPDNDGSDSDPELQDLGSLLNTEKHIKFLRTILKGPLPAGFRALDASKPWLIYWCCNALAILGNGIDDLKPAIVETILSAQCKSGGFGGGNQQLAHLAPSYAAINALALSGDEEAWDKIDRQACYNWIMSLKQKDGSFIMCKGGESDPRATYCAFSIASMLNIITEELVANSAEYISSCQTYEGGFANVPLSEAHGGYAFCALASLCFLGPPHVVLPKYINVENAIKWLSSRQMTVEGGFSGRINKLVDGCYNLWVGGCWGLLEAAIVNERNTEIPSLWNRTALKNYTIYCCQDPRGGLRDKPGKSPDSYHTNYVLCGLAASESVYLYEQEPGAPLTGLGEYAYMWKTLAYNPSAPQLINPIHPLHVLPVGVAEKMKAHFRKVPI